MVKDINLGSGSSNTYHLTNVNGTLFFNANDSIHGNELWKSDGTAAGTVMVADINPGSGSSYAEDLTNVNGTLFFTAGDDIHGNELWKSDGTAAGTVMVADHQSGRWQFLPKSIDELQRHTLFFSQRRRPQSRALEKRWHCCRHRDGRRYQSQQLLPLYLPKRSEELQWRTVFFSQRRRSWQELWKSDGTAAGTLLVADINLDGSSYIRYLSDANGTLLFTADDGIHGESFGKATAPLPAPYWSTTSTPQPVLILVPSQLTASGGKLFFTSHDDRSDTIQLWKTDGTAAGTVMLTVLDTYFFYYWDFINYSLTDVNGTLFFRADDGIHGFELWKSDGTIAGTAMVDDINPGGSSLQYNSNLINVNGTLFFTADDGTHGTEL